MAGAGVIGATDGMAITSPRRLQDGTAPRPNVASLIRLPTKSVEEVVLTRRVAPPSSGLGPVGLPAPPERFRGWATVRSPQQVKRSPRREVLRLEPRAPTALVTSRHMAPARPVPRIDLRGVAEMCEAMSARLSRLESAAAQIASARSGATTAR
mmetsp:Transcript_9270/g.32200  ORF Transcript_9270/g.32200 Transcript_9270/m.32200 type:complete len:154 (+) Transcript_9270:131-592(+)